VNNAEQLETTYQEAACSLIPSPPYQPPTIRSLMDVRDAANFLGVSESWVRRHAHELPAVRVGRLVRFDAALMLRTFSGKPSGSGKGESLGKEAVIVQRRYQNGSVYKRGKKKVWCGMFREDVRKPDGGLLRRQRKIRLGTLAELPTKHAAMNELQKHMALNSKPAVELTLSELVERWQGAIVPTLKHSTANFYVRSLNSRIVPTLGQEPISRLGRFEIELFLASKGKQYARNTLRELRSSLSRVLSWAVANNWIEKNPCHGVKLPHGTGKKITRNVLSPKQVKAIASKLEEPYNTLILFLYCTGLRIGEATGIQWGDFKGKVLNVQRRVYEGKADTLKTEKSKRSLPIPSALHTRLKKLDHVSEWVFSSKNLTPVNSGNALKRYIRPVAKKLGIPLSGFHDLRHTLATKSINSGVDPKTVSEILGHANVKITLDTYTHPALKQFQGPLNRMAEHVM
jgi:excisionase family DNA binding protein